MSFSQSTFGCDVDPCLRVCVCMWIFVCVDMYVFVRVLVPVYVFICSCVYVCAVSSAALLSLVGTMAFERQDHEQRVNYGRE